MAEHLFLRIRAPFAAFRPFQAGVYRSTLPTIPYSAAYGLILNFAGVEMRDGVDHAITGTRENLPAFELAIANLNNPETSVLYQQLHSYPVGNSGKEHRERTFGAKYWIAPAKRELLINLDCIVAMRGVAPELEHAFRSGLRGANSPRYGLPFAGDNNFLLDSVEILSDVPAVSWFCKVGSASAGTGRTCRLPVSIDRRDNTRTATVLSVASAKPSPIPPADAWTWTPFLPS